MSTRPRKIAGWGNAGYHIGIPKEIAEALPRDLHYVAELTDEGILFRPVGLIQQKPVDIPAWAKEKPA